MEYSAVIQPPLMFCSFIQRGTVSSTVTPQITRVLPHSMSVEPVACGAMWFRNRIERNWFAPRASGRRLSMEEASVPAVECGDGMKAPRAGNGENGWGFET